MKKEKILTIVYLFFSGLCFAFPVHEGQLIKYNNKPSEIISQYYNPAYKNFENSGVTQHNIKFTEIKNGIYLFEDNFFKYICYNLSYNTNAQGIILHRLFWKNNEQWEITTTRKSIEILAKKYPEFDVLEYKIIFEFDDNNMLEAYTIMNTMNNEIVGRYEYEYDTNKRPIEIYATYNWGKVLRKQIFYDGQLRNIPRPYFSDYDTQNIDEIIIFNGNTLKYHLKAYETWSHPYRKPKDLEEKEKRWDYDIYEYDENGDEIRYDGRYSLETKYLEYDNMGNWLHLKMYFIDNHGLQGEITREIKY